MSYFITSIIYSNKEFQEDGFYEALKQLEEFPIPHPHPIENFTKISLNSDVSAIYYQVAGYNTNLYCDMDGFLENTKYTERGFEIWQRMDGEAMHFFKEDDEPVQTEILNLKKEADENSLDTIFDELGVAEENIIQAFHRLEKEGVILAEFKS